MAAVAIIVYLEGKVRTCSYALIVIRYRPIRIMLRLLPPWYRLETSASSPDVLVWKAADDATVRKSIGDGC